jgi:hypothetical protein
MQQTDLQTWCISLRPASCSRTNAKLGHSTCSSSMLTSLGVVPDLYLFFSKMTARIFVSLSLSPPHIIATNLVALSCSRMSYGFVQSPI